MFPTTPQGWHSVCPLVHINDPSVVWERQPTLLLAEIFFLMLFLGVTWHAFLWNVHTRAERRRRVAMWAAAIAGLLIEAAMADGELDDTERAQVARILSAQPGLDAARVDSLIDDAVASHETRVEIHSLTRAIRGETEPEDRIAVLEMAWMVVMSDGEVHEYEAQLMRRLAGLLYVDDIESGRAAKRARARLEAAS